MREGYKGRTRRAGRRRGRNGLTFNTFARKLRMDMPISRPIKSRDMYCTIDRDSHVSSCSATGSSLRALLSHSP